MAEMISGVPLFRGRDNNDQLNQILRILGTPDDATLRRIAQDSPEIQLRPFPRMPRIPFTQLYPKASPLAIDLLDVRRLLDYSALTSAQKLLQFDPARRLSCEEAMRHPCPCALSLAADGPDFRTAEAAPQQPLSPTYTMSSQQQQQQAMVRRINRRAR